MDQIEELQKQLDESKQNFVKLSQDVQSKDEKIKALEAQAQESKALEQKAKVYSAIDDGIKAGKIAPVQREHLAALALVQFNGEEQTHKFSDGKGEIKAKTSLDVLGEMIEKLPVNIKFGAEGSTTEETNQETEKADSVENGGRKYSTDENLDQKVKAFQKAHGSTYTEAYQAIIREVK